MKPQNKVLLVEENEIKEIVEDELEPALIGEKAYGLACLPSEWTLPFFVISARLVEEFDKRESEEERTKLLERWSGNIILAASIKGIETNENIIIRSSGCREGLDERGELYSVSGLLTDSLKALKDCLEKINLDESLAGQKIPIILQRHVKNAMAKGHLSNERRCYKEARDWLGEFEDSSENVKGANNFQINLRFWRNAKKGIENQPLHCNCAHKIRSSLRVPAQWACLAKMRVHFEWVWDGSTVYLVQADEECTESGIDPNKVCFKFTPNMTNYFLKCLRKIDQTHAQKYNKIRNVFTYLKLGLPIANLYILDDKKIIQQLSRNIISEDLKADIRELIKQPLVIRIDLDTDDLQKRQLLPRAEFRDFQNVLAWMVEQAELLKKHTKEGIAFIFHNFVPAISAAFAYAAPGERKVQIEALWGLPEGLYYNAHDKFVVDTMGAKSDWNNIAQYHVWSKTAYKHFFISPDENGDWTAKIVKPPQDWGESIKDETLVRRIAYESRRIAEEEQKSLSIMWFVNVPSSVCPTKVFPWYHEHYDSSITNRAKTNRVKSIFDKSLVIRTKADLDILKNEANLPQTNVRRVRIQPIEKNLIRDKDTLKEIGMLTKKINAVILLEGGVLSHAYYQLMQTGAMVEVVHPFSDLEGKREFNKLVRDKVPDKIRNGGELIKTVRLEKAFLLKALQNKLVEEAFEVLNCDDKHFILSELADLNEVIDAVLSNIGSNRTELKLEQRRKRDKVGGFKKGIVLLDTNNPLPTDKGEKELALFENKEIELDGAKILSLSNKLTKWDDKKENKGKMEFVTRILVPLTNGKWETNSSELINDEKVDISLKGERKGTKIQLEWVVSSENRDKQLSLFDYFRSE